MERNSEEYFTKKKKKINIIEGFYGFTAFHIGWSSFLKILRKKKRKENY